MPFDYSTSNKRWRQLRAMVLRRDGYKCQESKRYGKLVQADTVHHIWPAEEYPQWAYCEWNLVALSNSAHNAMHDRDTHELTERGKAWTRRRTPPG